MAIHHVTNLKNIPRIAISPLRSIALLLEELETNTTNEQIQNMVTTQLNTLTDSLKDFLTDTTQQIEKVVNNNIQSLACLLDNDYTSKLTTVVSNTIQARLEKMIVPPTNKPTMMDHTTDDSPNQLTNIIKEDITLTIMKHIDMQLAPIHEKLATFSDANVWF